MVANGMPWDSHVLHNEIYQLLVPELDNVLYQVVTDLEERGLLDSTLVVWGGEFGRKPTRDRNGSPSPGRDHNAKAFSIVMAGGGVKPGITCAVLVSKNSQAAEIAEQLVGPDGKPLSSLIDVAGKIEAGSVQLSARAARGLRRGALGGQRFPGDR